MAKLFYELRGPCGIRFCRAGQDQGNGDDKKTQYFYGRICHALLSKKSGKERISFAVFLWFTAATPNCLDQKRFLIVFEGLSVFLKLLDGCQCQTGIKA